MIYYTKSGKYKKMKRKKKKLPTRHSGLKINVEAGVHDII